MPFNFYNNKPFPGVLGASPRPPSIQDRIAAAGNQIDANNQKMASDVVTFQQVLVGLSQQADQQAKQQAVLVQAANDNAAQNKTMAATRPVANAGGTTGSSQGQAAAAGAGSGNLLTGGFGINAGQYTLGQATLLGS